MKLEGSNAEYWTGDEALKKGEEFEIEKQTREKKKMEQENAEKIEKFNSIKIGGRVGYKATPNTPVESLIVESKDEGQLTVHLKAENEFTHMSYGVMDVTMDKIIDVDNSGVKE